MTVRKILSCSVTVLLVILLLYVVLTQITGGIPKLFGYSVLRIVTPSMESQIPSGTFILIRSEKAENLRAGDIITFYTDDPDPVVAGKTVTHRILEIADDGDGTYTIKTKGDNNDQSDRYPARSECVAGKYCRNLYFLTALANLFRTKAGLFIAVIIPGILLLQFGVRDLARQAKAARMDALVAEELERMKKEGTDAPDKKDGGEDPNPRQ